MSVVENAAAPKDLLRFIVHFRHYEGPMGYAHGYRTHDNRQTGLFRSRRI